MSGRSVICGLYTSRLYAQRIYLAVKAARVRTSVLEIFYLPPAAADGIDHFLRARPKPAKRDAIGYHSGGKIQSLNSSTGNHGLRKFAA